MFGKLSGLGAWVSEKATTVVESCKGATAKGQIETDDPYSPEQARVHYFGGSKGTFELRTEGTFESPPLWLEAKYTFVLEIDNFDVVDPRREVDKLLDGTDLGVFRASRRTVRVTGKLQAKGAAQLNDVQIEYEGTSHGTQLPNGTATTDEHGVFEVKLFEGGQYTFTPQPPEHHEFVGEPVVIHSLEKGQSQLEFVLARNTVDVTVQVTAEPNVIADEIIVRCNGTTSQQQNVPLRARPGKNAAVLQELALGGDYTFSVASPPYHTCTPAQLRVDTLGPAQGIDFTITRKKVTVRGKIKPASNETVGNIAVRCDLGNVNQRTVHTVDDGTFQFPDLLAGEKYSFILEPPRFHTLDVSRFEPRKGVGANCLLESTLTRVTHTVEGQVRTDLPDDGLVRQIDICATNNARVVSTVQTDANGAYTLTLPAGEKYTVAPHKEHYRSNPVEITLKKDTVRQDFQLELGDHRISLQFTDPNTGHGMSQVSIKTSSKTSIGCTASGKSDSQGRYNIDLEALGNFRLSFSKPNHTIQPDFIDIPRLDADIVLDIDVTRVINWYDRLPSPGCQHWDIAHSIASGRGNHSSDHMPDLVRVVGQGDFGRQDILPRIVAYILTHGDRFHTEPGICEKYRTRALPHGNGTTIHLARDIVVVWNFRVNPLEASCGTVYRGNS